MIYRTLSQPGIAQPRTAQPGPNSTLRPVMGPRDVPLRSTFRLLSDPSGLAADLRKEFGDVALTSALGRNVVVVQGPEAAAELLRDPDRAFANEPVYGFALGRLFDRGILLMDSQEHHYNRRLMQSAFTADSLAGYTQRLHPIVEQAIDSISTGQISMRSMLKALALDAAMEIFVGERLSASETVRMTKEFDNLIRAAGAVVRLRIPGLLWDRGCRARTTVDRYFADLVPIRRQHPGPGLMSALCHAQGADGERLSDDDVVDQMRFMLFAAHDTATIAMSSIMYRLGRNPRWQQRIRQEAQSGSVRPTLDELTHRPIMDAVFKESVRLRPPVPVIPRAATKDTSLLGYHIPAGTFVISLIGSNHRLPDIWPSPNAFDPYRFMGESAAGRHRMAWMPFGGGAHKCIGMHFAYMEAATVVHHFARSFEWSVPTDEYERADIALTANAGFVADVTRLENIGMREAHPA